MSWLAVMMLVAGMTLIAWVIVSIANSFRRKDKPPLTPKYQTCPTCGFLNLPAARFCGQCGERLEV